jgi:hypothetical protein
MSGMEKFILTGLIGFILMNPMAIQFIKEKGG